MGVPLKRKYLNCHCCINANDSHREVSGCSGSLTKTHLQESAWTLAGAEIMYWKKGQTQTPSASLGWCWPSRSDPLEPEAPEAPFGLWSKQEMLSLERRYSVWNSCPTSCSTVRLFWKRQAFLGGRDLGITNIWQQFTGLFFFIFCWGEGYRAPG